MKQIDRYENKLKRNMIQASYFPYVTFSSLFQNYSLICQGFNLYMSRVEPSIIFLYILSLLSIPYGAVIDSYTSLQSLLRG